MTDIVERLRREAKRFAAMDAAAERPWVADAAWAADNFSAAADEIDRLRAKVHTLSTTCGHCGDLERAWAEAATARRKGIEEAASIADGRASDRGEDVAAAIRTLLEGGR